MMTGMQNYDLKVLSIDFDYFQNTQPSTVKKYYPDGCDLPTDISNIVWSASYGKHSKGYDAINDVYIDIPLLNDIKSIIAMQSDDAACVVYESHMHIWNEIKERCKPGGSIMVAHIDFHHDFTNGNEERGIVDCGNWLYWAAKKYKSHIMWFTRKTSLECYACNIDEIPCHIDSLDYLKKVSRFYGFDLIYLCRSAQWVPPHLDPYFDELVKQCIGKFYDMYIEECVQGPRPMKEILDNAKAIDECIKQQTGGMLQC